MASKVTVSELNSFFSEAFPGEGTRPRNHCRRGRFGSGQAALMTRDSLRRPARRGLGPDSDVAGGHLQCMPRSLPAIGIVRQWP